MDGGRPMMKTGQFLMRIKFDDKKEEIQWAAFERERVQITGGSSRYILVEC